MESTRRLYPIAAVVALSLCFCSQPAQEPPVKTPPTGPATPASAPTAKKEQPRSIGSATMTADGTIKLMLRAESASGAIGDALILYPKSHPQYDTILKHLGGLKPGESKPVPPFPSK
jgi:hypothetical protein